MREGEGVKKLNPIDPSDSLATIRGKIGAYSLHAQGKTNTGPARAAFLSKFEIEVDPDGKLLPAERATRAIAARRAYFSQLSLAAAKARRANAS